MKMERWNENKALKNATKRLLSNHAFIWRGKSGHQRRTQVNKCWTCEDCILQNWIIYLQVTGTDILILENEIPCLSKKLFTLYNVWKYGSSIFVQSEILYNTVRYHFHEKSKNFLHEHSFRSHHFYWKQWSTTGFNMFNLYLLKVFSSICDPYKPVYSLWEQWSRV